MSAQDSFKTAQRTLAKEKAAKVSFYVSLPGGAYESGNERARFNAQTDLSIDYQEFSAPGAVLTNAIVLGSSVYMRGNGVAPSGKAWRSTDRITGRTGVELLDPMTYLKMASGASLGGLQKVAQTSGSDVPGTHYEGECQFGDNTGDCSTSDLGDIGSAFPGPGHIFFDVWLDGKGRPTHLAAYAELARADGTGGEVAGDILKAQMSISAFGQPVTITAPPPAQVAAG